MKQPIVSVIIPTYNRWDNGCLKKAIMSVLAQSYNKIEVIVADDGSTDGTRKGVEKLQEEYDNIIYCYKPNGGCASALNLGVKNSKGSLIAWLSSDDWYDMEENRLIERAVVAHTENPNVGLTYADYTVDEGIKGTHQFIAFDHPSRQACIKQLMDNCFINGSSIVIKKEVFYHVGFFNENFKYAQDYDFYFRVLSQYDIKKIYYKARPMLNYYYPDDGKHECLSKTIIENKYHTEGEVVAERYKLALDKNRPRVCALLCVKDEKLLIDQCLNDLSMYVDQIAVFDDGSTDGTSEVIKKWKKVTQYYYQQPKGNVRTEGADRQKLLELGIASGCEWHLFIDTDEVFEDRYKTEIHREMQNTQDIRLFIYQEVNFWRNKLYHRVDELFDLGWFGRLYKVYPGLRIGNANEHCGGIPCNIPDTPPWYSGNVHQRKSSMRVKHYGFANEERLVQKYQMWMERDHDVDIRNRHIRYDRILKEDTLLLKKYYERPYWMKGNDPEPEFLSGDKFGRSEAFKEELRKCEAREGIYAKIT